MKATLTLLIFACLLAPPFAAAADDYLNQLNEGDLIFQESQSSQADAIAEATLSRWTHVGILLKENGEWVVAEAVARVGKTPLASFVTRGKKQQFVVKRLREDAVPLREIELAALREALNGHYGKNYDIFFEWADDEIYCSEFVWKAYSRALSENAYPFFLSPIQRFRDLKLDGPAMKELIKKRYHAIGKELNLDEPVVTPVGLFESEKLRTVLEII